MSGPRRYRGSKDRNHDAIAAVFEALGCDVIDLSGAGLADDLDLAIGLLGETHLIEIKNPETEYGRKGMTTKQAAYAARWRGSPIRVITSELEATALVQNLRRAAAARHHERK